MKICKKCNIEKEIIEFYLKSNGKPRSSYCKECYKIVYNRDKENRKEYYQNNKDLYYSKYKEWVKNNKESRKEYSKNYYIKNKERIDRQTNECHNKNIIHKREICKINYNKRIKFDPIFKLIKNIRCLIKNSFDRKFTNKSKKTIEILGCSFEEFKIYLESKFDDKMNWENQGTYWHMDHIKPISLAQTEEEVYELNYYTNFQPLYWRDNILKGNKYIIEN
jgi:vacuolar-type H+-ATPase catalytic subunit A/Vma1